MTKQTQKDFEVKVVLGFDEEKISALCYNIASSGPFFQKTIFSFSFNLFKTYISEAHSELCQTCKMESFTKCLAAGGR